MRETKHIDRVLKANNYPSRSISSTRRRVRAGERGRNRVEGERDRPEKPLVVLPYVQGVTEKVTRVLKPHARIATKPGRNLKKKN